MMKFCVQPFWSLLWPSFCHMWRRDLFLLNLTDSSAFMSMFILFGLGTVQCSETAWFKYFSQSHSLFSNVGGKLYFKIFKWNLSNYFLSLQFHLFGVWQCDQRKKNHFWKTWFSKMPKPIQFFNWPKQYYLVSPA